MKRNKELIRLLLLNKTDSLQNTFTPEEIDCHQSLVNEFITSGMSSYTYYDMIDILKNDEKWEEVIEKVNQTIGIDNVPFEVIVELMEKQ
jgi:hypothetical protein